MIIRASINAKIYILSFTMFITIILLETFIILSHAKAESMTKECKAVDVLAEVYYNIEDTLSLGVYGADDKKHCQFSINGATKAANTSFSQSISFTKMAIYDLKNASKINDTEQIKYTIEKNKSNWVYLIAAPNLKNKVSYNLLKVFNKYVEQNSKCISSFYMNQSPNFDGEVFSCSIVDEKERILSIKISIGSYYELLLFR